MFLNEECCETGVVDVPLPKFEQIREMSQASVNQPPLHPSVHLPTSDMPHDAPISAGSSQI